MEKEIKYFAISITGIHELDTTTSNDMNALLLSGHLMFRTLFDHQASRVCLRKEMDEITWALQV